MENNVFPYGNDPHDPDNWAFKVSNLSKEWYICYHSGFSLACGMHTFLFFGTENLIAAVVNFIGCGLDAKFGIEKGSKLFTKSEGTSKFLGKAEEKYEGYKYDQSQAEISNLNSAKGIYDTLIKNGQICKAITPFKIDDLVSKTADLAGADVNIGVASGSYYSLMAPPLFAGWIARNVASEFTIVSAGMGVAKGFLQPASGKIFSLWNELAHSSTEEFPFRSYNVHPLFKNWQSTTYAYAERVRRVEEQNKILEDVGKDMVEHPLKYGFSDADQARDAYLERRKIYDGSGRDPSSLQDFMPWIEHKKQHIFYE